MYFLALNYGTEGWVLKEFDNLIDLIEEIKSGETTLFRIAKNEHTVTGLNTMV